MSKKEPEKEASPRLDRTIVKALDLIEFLAESEQPVGVSVIAQHFEWQKSNAHRILTTLKTLGYVRQDVDTNRYHLSLKTWELGMKVVGRSAIKRCAQPFMRALSQEFRATVNLSVLMGDDVLYLDSIPSAYPSRPTATPGARIPAIYTASGKSMLAYRSDAKGIASRIAASHPEARKVSWKQLKSELTTIDRLGYAMTFSGWRENVNSVAVAIKNSQNISVAAISVSGPVERMTLEMMTIVVPALLHAAVQIEDSLGDRGT